MVAVSKKKMKRGNPPKLYPMQFEIVKADVPSRIRFYYHVFTFFRLFSLLFLVTVVRLRDMHRLLFTQFQGTLIGSPDGT